MTYLDATIFGHNDSLCCCNFFRNFSDYGLFVIQIETHGQPPIMMLGLFLTSFRTRRPKSGVLADFIHFSYVTTKLVRAHHLRWAHQSVKLLRHTVFCDYLTGKNIFYLSAQRSLIVWVNSHPAQRFALCPGLNQGHKVFIF